MTRHMSRAFSVATLALWVAALVQCTPFHSSQLPVDAVGRSDCLPVASTERSPLIVTHEGIQSLLSRYYPAALNVTWELRVGTGSSSVLNSRSWQQDRRLRAKRFQRGSTFSEPFPQLLA